MSSQNILDRVRQFLASQYMFVDNDWITGTLPKTSLYLLWKPCVFVDNDWITGCVEFLCEEGRSETEIKNLAREQWLLNDLKDICPGSLPASLKNQPKTALTGRYVLQINAAIDIGTPAYQQYLKLQKVNMENVEATSNYEDKISSHRMIKLYLTDGVQEITAVEYRPMRNISGDITPGCKVLIKGPIECRRGVLLLTEASVELLGGEVGEITVSNSLAGLLSSKLGLPVTAAQGPELTPTCGRPPAAPARAAPPPSAAPPERPIARVTSMQVASSFNDDDIDLDQIADIEAQIIDPPTKRPQTDTLANPEKKIKIDLTTTDLSPRIDLTNFSNTNRNVKTAIDLTGERRSSVNPAKIDLTCNVNTVEDYPDDNEVLFDDDEDYLRELEAQYEQNQPCHSKNKGPIELPADPFVYIKEINDLPTNKRLGKVFKVKGQIMKLLSKLSVGKDGWSLRCTIVDGTGSIDVEFTSEVLSKLVGFTPQEMNQLKKQMATKPELKEKAVCALQRAKDNLQVLYCLIELTFLETPKITKLIPFDAAHAETHRNRVEGSSL